MSNLTGLPPTMLQEVTAEDLTYNAAMICSGEIASALADGNSGTVDNLEVHTETFDSSIDAGTDLALEDEHSSDVNHVPQALPLDKSAPLFEDLLVIDSDTIDECVQPSLQACDDKKHMQVLLSTLLSDLNNGTLEVSGISACKMFTELPDQEITIEVVDSMKNDLSQA